MRARVLVGVSMVIALALAPSCGDGGAGATAGSIDEYRSMCEAQADRANCEAVSSQTFEFENETVSCLWESWVPVSLDGEACVFGEPTAACVMDSRGSEGCISADGQCGPEGTVSVSREVDGTVELARAPWCYPPGSVCNPGELAECACACDLGFPQ